MLCNGLNHTMVKAMCLALDKASRNVLLNEQIDLDPSFISLWTKNKFQDN